MTTFKEAASFDSTVFKSEVNFRGAVFGGLADFGNTVFDRPVRVGGIRNITPSTGLTSFRRLPDFMNAKLTFPWDFDGIELPDVDTVRAVEGRGATRKYDALARLAAQHTDIAWQQAFVAASLRVRRPVFAIERWWNSFRRHYLHKAAAHTTDRLVAYVLGPSYGLFSNYGRSVLRPVLALVVLALIWTGLIVAIANAWNPTVDVSCGAKEAFFIAFRNGLVVADIGETAISDLWGCAQEKRATTAAPMDRPASVATALRGFKQSLTILLFAHKVLSGLMWFLLGMGLRFQLRIK